jgi:hypothetical protein
MTPLSPQEIEAALAPILAQKQQQDEERQEQASAAMRRDLAALRAEQERTLAPKLARLQAAEAALEQAQKERQSAAWDHETTRSQFAHRVVALGSPLAAHPSRAVRQELEALDKRTAAEQGRELKPKYYAAHDAHVGGLQNCRSQIAALVELDPKDVPAAARAILASVPPRVAGDEPLPESPKGNWKQAMVESWKAWAKLDAVEANRRLRTGT